MIEVVHTTRFSYDEKVGETYMEVRAKPWDGPGQRLVEFELEVRPRSVVREYVDGFGTVVSYFNHVPPHDRVEVVSRAVVDTSAESTNVPPGFPDDYLGFRGPVMDVAGVREMAARFQGDLEGLTRHINSTLTYQPLTTTVYTAVDEVLRRRKGVCQDFAHLFVAVTRAMGIPCRYVSGYVHAGAGRRGAGASHAWAEAFVDGRWVGYDPTNPLHPGAHHVRVGAGRDYQDVAPTRGTYVGMGKETMEAAVVTREL